MGGQMLTMVMWEWPVGHDPVKWGKSELRLVEGRYDFDRARAEVAILATERAETGRNQVRNLQPLLEQKGVAVIDRVLLAKLFGLTPESKTMDAANPMMLTKEEEGKVEDALHFYEYPPGGVECRCDRCVEMRDEAEAAMQEAEEGNDS